MKNNWIIVLMFAAAPVFAQDHDHSAGHHSDHNAGTKKQVAAKNKFTPTQDLKVRMEKILSLTQELDNQKDNKKTVQEYGNKITDTVKDIFKTCKLDPDADAAIHPSLGLILDGAALFQKGDYKNGHLKIHRALLNYEKLFKHDGWKHE